MILEAARMVRDALSDPTTGVNAMLASTPIDGGDSVPPAIAMIHEFTTDGNVARGYLPATLPGIAVLVEGVAGLEMYPSAADAEGDLTLWIRVGVEESATENGFRDVSYYLRTIARVLKAWHLALPSARTRNGICLHTVTAVRMVPLWTELKDGIITGAIAATYHLRDLNPT